MTDETEISPFTTNLPVEHKPHDLDDTIKENFQPHLILLHGSSQIVKDKKGEVGNYFLDEVDLGNSIEVIFCYPYRIHARKTVDRRKVLETFDENSETFRLIKAEKTDTDKGIMIKWGVSLLGYLPSRNKFFIYHPSTPSSRGVGKSIGQFITPIGSRKEADKLLPCTNSIRLTSTYVSEAPNPFWKPVCDPLNMGHFDKLNIPIPAKEKIQEQIDLFIAPTLIKEEEQEEGSNR